MSDRYPFDANGNLLPGLRIVDGLIVSASGAVTPAPVEEIPATETAAEPASETKPSLAEE